MDTPGAPPTLTQQQRLALMHITQYYAQAGEPCTAAYVARRLGVSRQVTRKHLSALVRAGLLASTSSLRPLRCVG